MTTDEEAMEAMTRIGQEWTYALEQLSEEDDGLLASFRLMGQVIDERYEMKGIRVLVGRCLVDPEFRSRVLEDAEAAMAELRPYVQLPEHVTIRCVENTADCLTVLLPPAAAHRTPTMRELIVTRASEFESVSGGGIDDNDMWPPHTGDVFTGDANFPHLGNVPHDAVTPMPL